MHKIFFPLIAIIIISSCSNDFDLNENWKDIPVTYGILNPKDTAQYIRVERVFNDPVTSALIVAQNTDSLYYKNISVKLKREKTKEEFPLQLIDGNLDGHVRDTGLFANAPNYLYKIKSEDLTLNPGEKYSLIIDKENGQQLTEATISIFKDFNIYLPSTNERPIKLGYISNLNINWDGGSSGGYYDLMLYINIEEKNSAGSGIWEDKTLQWNVVKNLLVEKYKITGVNFYRFLQDNLEQNPDISRRFLSFDIVVRGVGKELKKYTDILHTNLGITSSQQIPTYTNLSYGYGVFSSINSTEINGFYLDEVALDSLRRGIFTKLLNFRL